MRKAMVVVLILILLSGAGYGAFRYMLHRDTKQKAEAFLNDIEKIGTEYRAILNGFAAVVDSNFSSGYLTAASRLELSDQAEKAKLRNEKLLTDVRLLKFADIKDEEIRTLASKTKANLKASVEHNASSLRYFSLFVLDIGMQGNWGEDWENEYQESVERLTEYINNHDELENYVKGD